MSDDLEASTEPKMPTPYMISPLQGKGYVLPLKVEGLADFASVGSVTATFEAAFYPDYQPFRGGVGPSRVFGFSVASLPLGRNYLHLRYSWMDTSVWPPGTGQSNWYNTGNFYVMTKPVIQSPSTGQNIFTKRPVVSGSGHGGTSLRVVKADSPGTVLSTTITIPSTKNWSVTINQDLPGGSNSIVVEQSVAGYSAVHSDPVTFTVVYPATITQPRTNDVVRERRPEVSGTGSNGTTVTVYRQGGVGGAYGSTTVASGIWKVRLTKDLPEGPFVFHAETKIGTQLVGWSDPVPVTVRHPAPNAPVITAPGENSVQDQTFTISGTGGAAGATVAILKDFENIVLDTGLVKPGGSWDVTLTKPVPPGPALLAAKQYIGSGDHSGRTRRDFNIRPPRAVLQEVKADDLGTVTIKGAGYVGAELEIFYVNDSNYLHTFRVTETPWTKTYPDWLPGSYSIKARQWVSGIANQKIYSEWTQRAVDFVVKVPPPTLTPQVGTDQKPKFSGSGTRWAGHAPAKVELRITSFSNPILPSMPIVEVKSNGSWSNDAIERWDPGTYFVEARQLFTPTGKPQLSSEWTASAQVVIKAPLPSIDTIVENGLSPDITGTCWKGAVVTLIFSDANTMPHSVSDSDKDGKWIFRRPALFKPGSYTVKATQTFGGQTSNEVTKPFTVAVPKPVVTPLTPPVGYEPSIAGSGGYVGAEMTIYNYRTDRVLGKAMVIGEAWSVQLPELEFRDYQIYAVQSFGALLSANSERISFEVVLLPPTVDTPKPVDTVARTFRIEGHGSRASGSDVAQVWVWREEDTEPWARISVKYDGTWYYDATLPLGTETLRFKQFFKEQASEFTLDHVLGVVPAQPVIETPASGEAIESRVAISGFGYWGDKVSVAFADALEVNLGTTEVLENGTWSLWLLLDRPAGHPSLVVQQRFGDYLSGWTAPRPVELRTRPPQFTAPLRGRWVKSQPTFAGTARPGAEIRLQAWSNPDINLITSPAVGQDWEAIPPNELPQSEHWVCAVQSVEQGGGRVSATADSSRFEIMPAQDGDADLNL
ncbi:hypothetical protein PMI27_005347 [Pseudomonas sp. GM41(2012)]|uniref:hypothetical protein n=1 Tax=Pseudomonas sp. (strain GM41(2012)) TaxID=1144708 RepID=UPI00027029B9|nr:hypothetical protein [Pseudomonas sp. GM41(2012)]EUB71191.1 hypothetical protein PMI27_005347 [Pseudomonas sp. GM41(2012)]